MTHANHAQQKLIKRDYSFGSVTLEDGGRVSVSFDFANAPVPKETYPASDAFLKIGPGNDVFFVFSQIDAISGEVKHNLQVKFDDLAMLNVWLNCKAFYDRLGAWCELTYGVKLNRTKLEMPQDTQFHQLSANLAFMGHQEGSGVVAFYYFDPRAARDIATGRMPKQELLGTPVVQVKLNTQLILGLLNDIAQYIDKLTQRYPALNGRLIEKQARTEGKHA